MRKLASILLLFLVSQAKAGFNGLTHASITDCDKVDLVESASWDATKPHWLRILASHIDQMPNPYENVKNHFKRNPEWERKQSDGYGWAFTVRSTASCHGDSKLHRTLFHVQSQHDLRSDTGKAIVVNYAYYKDCSNYDGWWNLKLSTDKDIKLNNINLSKKDSSLVHNILSNPPEPNKELIKGITIIDSGVDKKLINDEKEKGYQENNLNNAKFLLNLKATARQEIVQNNFSAYGDHDTHLKNHYSDIKLAFKFNGIPAIKESSIIGYAAIGSYVKDDKHDGWDGIRVFFDGDELGICAYAYNTIYSAQLYSETVEYKINNKPSLSVIEGNHNNGFTYIVEWFDQDNMSTLECANKKLDKSILDKMIVLANKVDIK